MTNFGPPDNDYTWAGIARDIASKIHDGRLKNGDYLPRPSGVAREWGCSVNTVRRAYAELREKGLASHFGRRYYAGKVEAPAVPGDENTTFLEVPEVAKVLCIHPSTVFNQISLGKLESKKMGRRRLVYRSSVKRFLGRLKAPVAARTLPWPPARSRV